MNRMTIYQDFNKKKIAFRKNKNAPPNHPEGALYEKWSLYKEKHGKTVSET